MFRVTLAFILFTSAACAQEVVKRAEAEAISSLKPCNQPKQDDRIACQQNQWEFVEAYVSAKGGEPIAMLWIAGYFGPRHTADEREASLGIPENHVESCAWRIFNAATTSLQETFTRNAADFTTQTICPAISIRDYGAAFVRAGHLANQSNADGPFTRPHDWHPHIPWIKSNPLPPDLTTEVAPLKPN